VSIPRKLYEEAVKRGIDIESRIVELLAKDLDLDPRDEASLHLALAEKYMEEAKRFIEAGDSVQASEKLYKVAEECVKAMAAALSLEEHREAREKGRWTLKLLDSAARRLAKEINSEILHAWDHAYFLHVEGFHEARLSLDQVEARAKYVEELLRIAKEVVHGETRHRAGTSTP